MAIDRDALKKQLADQKARREGAFVQYIKKDQTRNLRIVEFTDAEGNTQFARTIVHFRSPDGKTTYLDRKRTFGAACAATQMEENAMAAGTESPFQRRQTQYYMNAIDLDKKPHKVQIFAMPTSVWEVIATMLVSEEWENVLEQEGGHPFVVVRTGAGLETEYTCTVSRKPFPVSDELMKQVKDPYTAVKDEGLEGQCKALGVTIEEVFPDGVEGLEMVEPIVYGEETPAESEKAAPATKPKAAVAKPTTPPAKPAVATPAAKPKATPIKPKPAPEPEPEEVTLEVGTRISADVEGETQEGVITEIDGDNATVQFDFDDANLYEVPLSDLTPVVEEATEPEAPAEDAELPVVKKAIAKPAAKVTATTAAAKLGGKPPAKPAAAKK